MGAAAALMRSGNVSLGEVKEEIVCIYRGNAITQEISNGSHKKY